MSTRNYPRDTLQTSLVVAQAIADENAGQPMNRLLVAHALGVKPASSNFKYLLSSSRSYGLTEGTEKATEISLTPLGRDITGSDTAKQRLAMRRAALHPDVFQKFFDRYNSNRLPSPEMMTKILVSDFGVPEDRAAECAGILRENGDLVGIIRSISGASCVLLDSAFDETDEMVGCDDAEVEADIVEPEVEGVDNRLQVAAEAADGLAAEQPPPTPTAPKAIFLGHGRNTAPVERLEKLLASFGIPSKRAVVEPNLGRPIPTKVRETMEQCGSAILIFTRDQLYFDKDGNEVWLPSDNVVHELGASSFAYGDKVVIFKEAGVELASNFSNIGRINFDQIGIEAKWPELLQELVGFGLVKITPT